MIKGEVLNGDAGASIDTKNRLDNFKQVKLPGGHTLKWGDEVQGFKIMKIQASKSGRIVIEAKAESGEREKFEMIDSKEEGDTMKITWKTGKGDVEVGFPNKTPKPKNTPAPAPAAAPKVKIDPPAFIDLMDGKKREVPIGTEMMFKKSKTRYRLVRNSGAMLRMENVNNAKDSIDMAAKDFTAKFNNNEVYIVLPEGGTEPIITASTASEKEAEAETNDVDTNAEETAEAPTEETDAAAPEDAAQPETEEDRLEKEKRKKVAALKKEMPNQNMEEMGMFEKYYESMMAKYSAPEIQGFYGNKLQKLKELKELL